jgi:hypothetical protein
MKPTSARLRLERALTRDRTAILDADDVRALDREVRRALVDSFPGLPAHALDHTADIIRWSSLGARCQDARGVRGMRDVSVATGIPQYRLRAVERGRLSEFRADLARRYFRFLGVEEWVAKWCRANRELAARAGLVDSEPSSDSMRARQAVHRRAGGRG